MERNNIIIGNLFFLIEKIFHKFSEVAKIIQSRKIKNWPIWIFDYLNFYKNKSIIYFLKNGQKIKVRAGSVDKMIVKEIFVDNYYIPQGFEIQKGDTVVDIGAHIGTFSVFASGFASKIYSFEPLDENFQLLKENIAINNIGDIAVPFNSAVSDKTGKREFFICSNNSAGHSFYFSESFCKNKKIIVPTVSLEDFVASNNISVINFLKIDCEGAEYDILLKCPTRVLNIVQKISMECHDIDSDRNVSLLEDFLKENGFAVNINGGQKNRHLYAQNKNIAMLKNKKIAIFFPYFSLGGGEVVAAWMIEALKEDHDVTLFTCDAVDADMLNRMYDTNLTAKDFRVINPPMSFLLRKIPILGLLKYHILVRYYKLLNKKFDALIGAWNIIDFGERGIQYIDSIEYNFDKYNLKPFHLPKIYQYAPFLRNFYKNLYCAVSGYKEESMKKNITLVISLWTKDIIQDTIGIDSIVVYPPVEGEFPKIDWDKRENGFICLGRISPEKEIEKVIEILSQARKNNPDIHLHIIGGAKDLVYGESIKNLCDKNKEWCFLEGEIYGTKKAEFIARHRFGISGRVDEFFGIATAEMAKAGCIVFVPNSGGQVEIANNSQLIYKNKEDAIEKISKVLNDKNFQAELQKHLLNNNKKFSTENFKKEIKKIVEDFISQKNS